LSTELDILVLIAGIPKSIYKLVLILIWFYCW